MKPYSNVALDKKFEQIEASPEVAKAIARANNEILPGIKPIWATELKQMDTPPPSWLVQSLVSDSGINMLSSKPGTFKTWLCFDIAKCVATGEPLFGVFATKQTKVLIIDQESGLGRVKKRLAMLDADETDVAVMSFANVKMSEEYAKAIIEYCKANGIGLVIFDSLTRLHAAKESNADEMSEVLANFQALTQAGIAVIVIHHDPKSGYSKPDSSNTLRGSGDILAVSDVHLVLFSDKYSTNKIIVKQLKSRDEETIEDFELAAKSNGDKTRLWFEYIGEAPKLPGKAEATDQAIIELLTADGELYQGQIIEALQGLEGVGGQKMIAERLGDLAAAKRINLRVAPDENNKSYYSIAAEVQDE